MARGLIWQLTLQNVFEDLSLSPSLESYWILLSTHFQYSFARGKFEHSKLIPQQELPFVAELDCFLKSHKAPVKHLTSDSHKNKQQKTK
jgi:hypothetical protein